MNKTLRNKALRNVSRLITTDMNGEDWAAPDGYFATAAPIYEGYKVKKDQSVPEQKPDLNKILPSSEYIKADVITPSDVGNGEYINIQASKDSTIFTVSIEYWTLLTNIYPQSVAYVEKDGYKFAPVYLKEGGVLVAVIMPIKR